MNSKFSEDALDKVAQSIYEFDSAHRGYVIEWEELEPRIRSEYLYEAECAIEAVLEALDRVAQSIYEFDSAHLGYLIEWNELEPRIQSEYLYEAECAIEAVLEVNPMWHV